MSWKHRGSLSDCLKEILRAGEDVMILETAFGLGN